MAYQDQKDWEGNQFSWVEVGDRVKFTQYAGWLHEEPGDEAKYRVMHDLDIIMVEKADE